MYCNEPFLFGLYSLCAAAVTGLLARKEEASVEKTMTTSPFAAYSFLEALNGLYPTYTCNTYSTLSGKTGYEYCSLWMVPLLVRSLGFMIKTATKLMIHHHNSISLFWLLFQTAQLLITSSVLLLHIEYYRYNKNNLMQYCILFHWEFQTHVFYQSPVTGNLPITIMFINKLTVSLQGDCRDVKENASWNVMQCHAIFRSCRHDCDSIAHFQFTNVRKGQDRIGSDRDEDMTQIFISYHTDIPLSKPRWSSF